MSIPLAIPGLHSSEWKIGAKCHCEFRRRPPIRLIPESLVILRRVLGTTLPADLPVGSWRCNHCKAVVPITLKDLHLAA